MFVMYILSLCAPLWCEEPKPIVISEAHKTEALLMRKKAKELIEIHKDVAMSKAQEAKEIVQNVIVEAKGSNNTSPCLSTNNTTSKGCAVVRPQAHALSSTTTLGNESTQLVIFVSFSMPEASLKALFKEVEKNTSVRLVLQGLIDDSMEKTAQKIHELEGVVDIDPELFEKYRIERVPTFLWVKQGQPLAKLTGNITITYAQEIYKTKLNKEGSPS